VAVIFLIAFVVIYEFVRDRFERRKALMVMGGILILLFIGVFALESLGAIRPLTGKFLRVIDPRGASKSPLYESVAEHKRSAWSSFFGSFGLTFVLGMLGTYFALTEPDEKRLYGAFFLRHISLLCGGHVEARPHPLRIGRPHGGLRVEGANSALH
jgi:hypothetical protein